MSVKPIPDGFHTITPYLTVQGVNKLLDFVTRAFGAEVKHQSTMPDGTVMHAEVRIGDSPLMMGEAMGPWKAKPGQIYLYVPDADAVYERALAAGATSIMPMADQFYGDRHGGVTDPVGNMWWIAKHIEDVSPEEMKRREQEYMKKRSQETPPEGAAAPKRAAELDALEPFARALSGKGRAHAGPFGPEHELTGSFTGRWELGGHWLAFSWEEQVTPAYPVAMNGQGYWGWDASAGRYVGLWVDAMGATMNGSSPGWRGDELVWTWEGNKMGKKAQVRGTWSRKGDRIATGRWEANLGEGWMQLLEMTF